MRWLFLAMAAANACACGLLLGPLAYMRINRVASLGQSADIETLLEDRATAFALMAAAAAVVAAAVNWMLLPIGIVAACVLSRRAPALLSRRRRRRHAQACESQLDVLADIVAMGVGAGLSFDAALDMYCTKFSGELAEELELCRALYRSGIASRSAALADMATALDSAGFKRFAETSTQAIERGAPLARMLSGFADDVRRQRRNELEQRIAKAPVKMLVPTGLLILPAMLILVMGPALLQFLGSGF